MIIFDIGSNATKASLVLGKQIVYNWRISTKIGKDVLSDGSLSDDAIDRQISAIAQILNEASKMPPDPDHPVVIHALGTQALRKAPNSSKLVSLLKEQFDLTLEIISGDREAELEKIAVWDCDARKRHTGSAILTIDSGGSSTEFNLIAPDGTTLQRKSYPFGQHDILRALESNTEMPFSEMMSVLRELTRTAAPQIVIAAGSSVTTYAAYALMVIPFDAAKVESRQLPVNAEVPEGDGAACAGRLLVKALAQATEIPIFAATRGIRHGWLAEYLSEH